MNCPEVFSLTFVLTEMLIISYQIIMELEYATFKLHYQFDEWR